jgi:hypothetical protein
MTVWKTESLPQEAPIASDATPIDTSDKDAVKKLCMGELVAIVQANKGSLRAVPAIKELLDRIEGKPTQTINQTIIGLSFFERRAHELGLIDSAQPMLANSTNTIENDNTFNREE